MCNISHTLLVCFHLLILRIEIFSCHHYTKMPILYFVNWHKLQFYFVVCTLKTGNVMN